MSSAIDKQSQRKTAFSPQKSTYNYQSIINLQLIDEANVL